MWQVTCSPRPPTLSQRHWICMCGRTPRQSYIFQVSFKSVQGFRSHRGSKFDLSHYSGLYYRIIRDYLWAFAHVENARIRVRGIIRSVPAAATNHSAFGRVIGLTSLLLLVHSRHLLSIILCNALTTTFNVDARFTHLLNWSNWLEASSSLFV